MHTRSVSSAAVITSVCLKQTGGGLKRPIAALFLGASICAAVYGTSMAATAPAGPMAGSAPGRTAADLSASPAPADAGPAGLDLETRPYWVFFRDRGEERLDATEVARLADAIPAESWERRACGRAGVNASRFHGVLPDEKDLPLWEPYVQRAAAYGELRHRSRWFNAVSLELTREAVRKLTMLPFVSRIRPVAHGVAQSINPRISPDGRPLETTLPAQGPQPTGPAPYGPSYGQLNEIGVPPCTRSATPATA